MSVVSGLTITRDDTAAGEANFVRFLGKGTYTAADFTISASPMYAKSGSTIWDPNISPVDSTDEVTLHYSGLPWKPKHVRVYNLTDGTGSEWWLNSIMTAGGFTQVAAGDKTVVAAASAGVSWTDGILTVDVSACAPITDNDEFVIECRQ